MRLFGHRSRCRPQHSSNIAVMIHELSISCLSMIVVPCAEYNNQFVNLFLRITVRAPMVPHRLVTAILVVFTMFLMFLCNTLTSCYSSQTVDDRSLTNDARNKMTQSESESKWKNLSCSSGVPICKIDRPILCRRNTYSKVTALWRSCCFSWAFLELHLCA